ncbi:MAG: PaaI family thioesterase [Deltaproteobacteria bacterium]|nr:PaaI family thioesterase [Deltaproteobacteria bacterium]MBW2532561.1 PaaI family thioesterase [Deltaproteobacteria bacterium]
MRVGALREGFIRLELPWRDVFTGDPMRPAMHGGVISTLADTAGGMAVWTAVPDEMARVSTIDLRVDYLLPGAAEDLIAEATVVRVGNRVGVADMRVFHPAGDEEPIATAKGVYAIRPSKAVDDTGEGPHA